MKHLVEAHRGAIHVRSDGAGRGATFTVRLPVGTGIPEGVAPSPATRCNAAADRSLAGISVLVVDDDDESRDVVAAQLRQHEAVVLTADSAAHAFDVLQHERIDVLLADIAMPEEDGYSLLAPCARPAARRGRHDSGGRHHRPGPRRRSTSGPPGRVSTSYAEADRSQRRSSRPCQSCTPILPGIASLKQRARRATLLRFRFRKAGQKREQAPRWFRRASPAAPNGRHRG